MITPKLSDFAIEYPELFHYTGLNGLLGILQSQMLWATHASYLNDATEIRAFEARLPEILRPAIEIGVAELIQRSPANQNLVDEHGGMEQFVRLNAEGIATAMFKTVVGDPPDVAPFAEPFVSSFCATKDTRISQHGLLSQWRGYGRDGGYALAFDTARLEALMVEEGKNSGCDLFGGNVIYSSDSDELIRTELGEDMEMIAKSVEKYICSGGLPDALEDVYYPLIRCACRYKHWGFAEEKEVRLVIIPPNPDLFAEQKARGLIEKTKPRHHFVRGGIAIPCIHLFEGITSVPDKPLPISRIIVGPHPDKEARRNAILGLTAELGLKIDVSTSKIPYVENS